MSVLVENDRPIDSRHGLQDRGRQPQRVLIAQEVMKPPFYETLVTVLRWIGTQQVLVRDQLMHQGGIVQHHEKRAPPVLGKIQSDGEKALRRRLVRDGIAPQSVALDRIGEMPASVPKGENLGAAIQESVGGAPPDYRLLQRRAQLRRHVVKQAFPLVSKYQRRLRILQMRLRHADVVGYVTVYS